MPHIENAHTVDEFAKGQAARGFAGAPAFDTWPSVLRQTEVEKRLLTPGARIPDLSRGSLICRDLPGMTQANVRTRR